MQWKGFSDLKKILVFIMAVTLTAICACANSNAQQQGDSLQEDTSPEQAAYQLKAGQTIEVTDQVFENMVTVTVDPDSTRSGDNQLRSNIVFDQCTFNGGLTIVGDYHAMITLGSGCSFGEGTAVICKEATAGVARDITLEDNLVKVLVACEGVAVETDSAIGVLTDGPDVIVNGTTYRKTELAPDTAFLGVYCLFEGDTLTYTKLAIGEDDSVKVVE